jgi:hypothetical protein
MSEYLLKDICLYTVCPLKLFYKNAGKQMIVSDADDRYIISTALRETYIKYFQLKGLGKPMSIRRAAALFSSLAFDYKSKWTKDSSKFFQDTKSLVDAHSLVVNIDKFLNPSDELVAALFPLERNIGQHIVKDESDLIIFRHPPKKESYVEIVYFDISNRDDPVDFNLLLRANFGLSVVTRELMGEALTIKSTLYNLLSGKITEITLSREHRFNYQKLIRNIINGIEAKVYYPRPSYGTCEHCSYSNNCSWKINEKDKDKS